MTIDHQSTVDYRSIIDFLLIFQAAKDHEVSIIYEPFVTDVASYYVKFDNLPPAWPTCDLCRFPMFLAQIHTEEKSACHKCGLPLLESDANKVICPLTLESMIAKVDTIVTLYVL